MNKRICEISLFSLILACVSVVPGEGAVKSKNSNRSYSGAYQQINAMRYEQEYMNATAQTATTASATEDLPVAVDDEDLARSIVNNESDAPAMSKLESCAMIYPNGVFKWAIPESGVRKNPVSQCVAVVELKDANTNVTLATTTLAAGDSMKCNIDYFPESGYNMAALSKVELPADVAPTIEDVEAVMNEEQKQNAGLKIVAAALVGGVAGNFLAPKEAGAKNSKIPFGTGKTQLIDTAIGATAGAGIMAASTYTGKVAGDTIKSTAVNAASGMIIGNMLAGTSGGNGIIATTKCSVKGTEYDCVVGKVVTKGEPVLLTNNKFLIYSFTNGIRECVTEENDTIKCSSNTKGDITDVMVQMKDGGTKSITEFTSYQDANLTNIERYQPKSGGGSDEFETVTTGYTQDHFLKIASAYTVAEQQSAYAVFPNGTLNKVNGYQQNDWDKNVNLKGKNPKYYTRNMDGSVGDKQIENMDNSSFTPSTRDASDGGLIDMSNQARIKGTVAGGAVGGALGGVSAYSGAKSEVTDRWTASVREYEDSLSNFVCITGGRYLAKYNAYAEIPEAQQTENAE